MGFIKNLKYKKRGAGPFTHYFNTLTQKKDAVLYIFEFFVKLSLKFILHAIFEFKCLKKVKD